MLPPLLPERRLPVSHGLNREPKVAFSDHARLKTVGMAWVSHTGATALFLGSGIARGTGSSIQLYPDTKKTTRAGMTHAQRVESRVGKRVGGALRPRRRGSGGVMGGK